MSLRPHAHRDSQGANLLNLHKLKRNSLASWKLCTSSFSKSLSSRLHSALYAFLLFFSFLTWLRSCRKSALQTLHTSYDTLLLTFCSLRHHTYTNCYRWRCWLARSLSCHVSHKAPNSRYWEPVVWRHLLRLALCWNLDCFLYPSLSRWATTWHQSATTTHKWLSCAT